VYVYIPVSQVQVHDQVAPAVVWWEHLRTSELVTLTMLVGWLDICRWRGTGNGMRYAPSKAG
jgi:hypothetical protein